MTTKQYKLAQITVAMVLAIVFSQAIILRNYIIPVCALIVGALILFLLRRKVKEIIADERDQQISGEAASWAIQIFSWISVLAMIIFYALRDTNPAYEPISVALAYGTMVLILIYSLIFHFKNKLRFSKFKMIYLVLGLILLLILIVAGLRLLSGEDDWICQNGQWIKHGNPSFSMPTVECK